MSHSYLKNTEEVGKKTALKLINKYADSFNLIKDENKQLKMQIEDLKSNLKINKSIIEGFFSKLNSKEKESSIISQIKKENLNLYNQNEQLRKKIEDLNAKININQQNYLESTIQIKEENEHLKTKLFMMEQVLQKKDNIINRNKKKLSLYKNGFIYNQKEIYVTNPSKLINDINNELLTYKDMYSKNIELLKDSRIVLDRYEKKIIELQNENQTLRQEYKMHIFNTNRERETLMTTIQKERIQLRSITEDNANLRNNSNFNDEYGIKNKIYNNKKNLITKSEYESKNNKLKKNNVKKHLKKINEKKTNLGDNININIENKDDSEKGYNICNNYGSYLNNDQNKLKLAGESRKNNFIYGKGDIQIYKDNYFLSEIEDKQYEHEEFIDIIKNVGLSLEKFEELTKVKFFSEFTEIIEMLLNSIKEKEKVIIILQREIDNLNADNFKLNKDNMFLFNQNINLKKELSSLTSNNNISILKNKNNSLTFMNNLNKINEIKLNPKIKDSIHNYKEYLNINQKENRSPTDNILNIQRVIIESSIDMESSTLKEKFEKEKEKMKKDNKIEETSISNGLTLNKNKENEKLKNNLFVKPILEKNEEIEIENYNENLLLEQEKEKHNKKDDNKETDDMDKNTVTSSEFREECPGIDSFLSTLKFDETKKN